MGRVPQGNRKNENGLSMFGKKKIILFGLGSIGFRHARLLLNSFNHELYAFKSGNGKETNALAIKEIYTWNEIEKIKPDIAFIANPTYLHIETAIRCASLGMHLFIEKPLSNTLNGIDDIASICNKKNLTCYVAYSMRFHPVIREVKKLVEGKKVFHVRTVCSSYLPDWRKGRDHKTTYSASIYKGGGVLLDLSHELDYLQYIFGEVKNLKASFGRLSDVTLDAEDYADILMTGGDFTRINLHLNFFSLFEERSMKIDFEGGYMFADILENRIDYRPNGHVEHFNFDTTRDEYFLDQIRYFLDNIGNPLIMNNIKESKRLLKQIQDIKNG
jgi:predicted dehydrogenase